jgi:hypothetical protein
MAAASRASRTLGGGPPRDSRSPRGYPIAAIATAIASPLPLLLPLPLPLQLANAIAITTASAIACAGEGNGRYHESRGGIHARAAI